MNKKRENKKERTKPEGTIDRSTGCCWAAPETVKLIGIETAKLIGRKTGRDARGLGNGGFFDVSESARRRRSAFPVVLSRLYWRISRWRKEHEKEKKHAEMWG